MSPTAHRFMVVCLCGRTASGKSTAATRFAARAWGLVESGKVVADLLGSAPVHSLGEAAQQEFRDRAMQLVRGDQPTPLVRALCAELVGRAAPVCVVGVRQVSTLEGLRLAHPSRCRVAYIDATVENCAARYGRREARSVSEYSGIAVHEVEGDQARIKAMADRVVDNNGSLVDFEVRAARLVQEWSNES